MMAGGQVARALAIACIAIGVLLGVLQAPAMAAAPLLTITQPLQNSSTNAASISFAGTTNDVTDPVRLTIEGSHHFSEQPPVESGGGSWSSSSSKLPEGQYTAVAEQSNGETGETGEAAMASVTFTVERTRPSLTLTSPSNDSVVETSRPTFSGQGGVERDAPSVNLKIYAGTSTSASPVYEFEVPIGGPTWSSGAAGPLLANGIYTVVAERVDAVGNATTATATFAVVAPAASAPVPVPASRPSPLIASFQWFPASPHVGESVSLVSTSSDAGSTITGFAWSLVPGGPLLAGQHVLTTSFATAGSHVVRLRVTDARGLSSEVSATIAVSARPLTLMQPFPVVRIAGSAKSSGVRIALFTVLAPVGARVGVLCDGHGCPSRAQSFVVAPKSRAQGGTALISFGRFEHWLQAGDVLEVRISKAGEIGKYTRFTVRRGRLPARVDTCLSSSGTKPMQCPS